MKLRLAVPIGVVLTIVAVGLSQSREQRGPVFTQDGSLVLPTGFREWVFVGGTVTPNALNNGKALFPEFHEVYVEPENYRYYQQHGVFPEGTVLFKELILTQPGAHPDGSADSASGRGYFPGSLHGADVMVKDSKRFGNTHNWGFFSFGHHAPPYDQTASLKSPGECAACHIAGVSKTDMVWIQYYPSLTAKIK